MKALIAFLKFMLDDFLRDKELTVTGCGPWVDYDTHEEKGTKIEVAVTQDATVYPPGKDGRVVTNLFEKFAIKVPKTVSVPVGAVVTIVNGTATVYGDYRNQLSVRAEDVKVVQASVSPATNANIKH